MMFLKNFRLTPLAMASIVLCHSAALAEDAVLPAVTVSGAKDATVPQSNRLGVPLTETAQAATIIDAELIRAQEARNIDDVLTNAPGVVSGVGGQAFQNFFMRGFFVDNVNNYLRDGLRFDRQHEVSLQNIEQVEVVRGPASLQYGKLAPGGLINFVTKKPQVKPMTEVSALVNNFGQVEGALDSTGPLGDSGKVFYRLNVEAKKLNSFRDHVEGDAYLIAPALTFALSNATTIDVNFEHTKTDVVGDSGQPTTDGATIGTVRSLNPRWFYGEKDATWYNRSNLFAAHLKHNLNDAWQLRADYLTGKLEREVYQVDNWGLTSDGNSVTRTSLPHFLDQRSSTMRVELGGKLTTGAVKHNVLAGVDHLSRTVRNQDGVRADIASVDLFNPSPRGNTFFDPARENVDGENRGTGIYLQDQAEIGRWTLMAGIRHDRLKDSSGSSSQRNSHTSPTGAVMFHVLPNLSLYASYSESFELTFGRDFFGNMFTPALGKQYEVGVKGSLNQSLQWSATVFDLRKTNILTRDPDPTHPDESVQTGEQSAKGVELELSGRVTPALLVHGAFSYLDTEVVKDNRFPVGNELRMAPRHTARLWGEYAFAGAWQGWSASLGTTYVGQRYTNLFNRNVIPSFVVWDAGVRYRITKNDTLQLAVKNLTNRRYIDDALDADQVYQGAPRTVSLRYIHTF